MKKVLIITYYWPPSGGGGVQRWLKFAKYLPEFGWEPVIFTPENPDFSLQDETLSKDVSPNLEVIRFPIWEPFGVYKKLFKSSGQTVKQGIVIEKSKLTLGDRISIWVRANLFIPDPRRFWVKPSANFLKSVIEDNQIDLVITTGPPHSMHLIGLSLKKSTGVKWIADFRDPWSDWDVLDKLNITSWARAMHKRLERNVMKHCDVLLTVSNRLADLYKLKTYNRNIEVVNNGVDEEDFIFDLGSKPDGKFRIVHMGLLNEIRNPEVLWEVLSELCEEDKEFCDGLEIVLAGMVSGSILDQLKADEFLGKSLNYLDYIPHQEVFVYYQSASIQLLLLNQSENAKWILPGKMYEYMFSGKPILTLGEPESDVNDLLIECEVGKVIKFDDKEQIKAFVKKTFADHQIGIVAERSAKALNYSRKNLTEKLSRIMNEVCTD